MFRRFTRPRLSGQGPWVLAGAIVLALFVAPFAVAATGGGSILGGKRNPTNPSAALTSETQIIANNSTYGTRQSNLSDNGGGAIYGCRSKAGGSEKGFEPCIRVNNLADGRAFEFEGSGTEIGRITSSNPASAPFTTNATGVATGLNADKVDGKSATDIEADALTAAKAAAATAVQGATLIAQVSDSGALQTNRGASAAARTSEGNYTVTFASDISACAIQATESQFANAGAVGVQLGDDHKTVTVRTRSGGGPSGTDPVAIADRPFHLTVSC